MLLHPSVDFLKVAGSYCGIQVKFLPHAVTVHRVIHVAERIGREITEARGPVDILEYAGGIICRTDSEILLILVIPDLRQIFNADLARHNRFFDLIADHNVEDIRELIRFRANAGRRHTVYSLIELPLGNIRQYFTEDLFYFREDQVNEGFRSSDNILVEAGRGLVLAHGLAAGNIVIPVFAGLILIEQRMSALMDRAVHAGEEVVREEMRCHTLIVRSHTVRKRMLRRRESAALKIKADHTKQVFDRSLLGPVIDSAL